MSTHYLACDLGAESGRLMSGTLDQGKIELRELHRLPNTPISSSNSLHWNIPALVDGFRAGLRAASSTGHTFSSLSTDSWGVDYVLLDKDGQLLSPTFHYRDSRTAEGVRRVFAKTDWSTVFDETGLQFMPLNTLFQLAAEDSSRLQQAARILGIGDFFNFLASGIAKTELSLASTFQLYNPVARRWSSAMLQTAGVREDQLGEIVPPGTVLGPVVSALSKLPGLAEARVVASCSHDTGAAVAAVPAQGKGWAYLSSGTWSLMGLERPAPVVTATCRDLNFTNEIGFGGAIRLLKNISGLWIIQECRRSWERQGMRFDYDSLSRLASQATPFRSLMVPSDPRFLAPVDMPSAIAAYCMETSQPVPDSPGAFARCAFESLALLYRHTRDQLQQLTGEPVEHLHIVGGGSRNHLLNQFTSDALQCPVLAGPVEATAMGNVLVQAIALGHLPSLEAARDVVRRSSPLREFSPGNAQAWDQAFLTFQSLLRHSAV